MITTIKYIILDVKIAEKADLNPKNKIRLYQPEEYNSSRYNKYDQENNPYFCLTFMTNPGRCRVFRVDIFFFAQMTGRGWLCISAFF